jgi:hypothetical protein
VVIPEWLDWLNCSLTPCQRNSELICTAYTCVSILKGVQRILIFFENKHFQLCHTSRHKTRAGFDSAPQVSVEKGWPSIMRYGPPLNDIGAAHTKHPGLLLT